MLQDFQDILTPSLSAGQMLFSLSVAFLCGLIITLFYRWTYKGSNYSPTFVRSMIYLAMISAVIIVVIGNNLARAFGLVGAMSIIRFRTAVKDTQDIVFIFFSLAIGLAAGVGMHALAIGSTILIGLVILITSKTNYAAINRKAYLLQFTYHEPGANNGSSDSHLSGSHLGIMKKYCKVHRLVNVRSVKDGQQLDLTYFVNLRNRKETEALTSALGKAPHVSQVNLFYDEEQQ